MSLSNYIEYILKYAEKNVLKYIYQHVNNDLYWVVGLWDILVFLYFCSPVLSYIPTMGREHLHNYYTYTPNKKVYIHIYF